MFSSGKSLVVANAEKIFSRLDISYSSAISMLTSLFCVLPSRNSADGAPVFSLDEGTLLRIFGFLPLRDLLRACQVCRLWYRLSHDLTLCKTTDLRRFSKSLEDPKKFQAIVLNRLAEKIHCLDLSGFVLTEESLRVLATHCKKLRVLKLRSVTFAENCTKSASKETVIFPKHLECLDIRYSHGSPRVYRAIGKELGNLKWLGLCDAFIQALLSEDCLETTIDSMKYLRKLDLSHCLLLKDCTLTLFARCKKLEVLSVRRCSFLTGAFVEDFLDSCTKLKTLILDGISLDDETLQQITWRYSSLKHLELGWCRFITPVGLNVALPRIARIKTLEYLGLCAIGDEKALDDNILLEFGASLSRWGSKKLQSLNVGRSRSLTQVGVDKFHRACSYIKMLDTTDCPAIKHCSTKGIKQHQNEVFHDNDDNFMIARVGVPTRRRNGSISATQFARSKYVLETPL